MADRGRGCPIEIVSLHFDDVATGDVLDMLDWIVVCLAWWQVSRVEHIETTGWGKRDSVGKYSVAESRAIQDCSDLVESCLASQTISWWGRFARRSDSN